MMFCAFCKKLKRRLRRLRRLRRFELNPANDWTTTYARLQILTDSWGMIIRNHHDFFVPLHCQEERRTGRAGHQKLVFRPGNIFSLPRAQKRSREWRRNSIHPQTLN